MSVPGRSGRPSPGGIGRPNGSIHRQAKKMAPTRIAAPADTDPRSGGERINPYIEIQQQLGHNRMVRLCDALAELLLELVPAMPPVTAVSRVAEAIERADEPSLFELAPDRRWADHRADGASPEAIRAARTALAGRTRAPGSYAERRHAESAAAQPRVDDWPGGPSKWTGAA